MDFIQFAIRADLEKVAHLSFDCLECGLCAIRCPAEIVPHLIARLARRLHAKYMMPPDKQVRERIREIEEGKFDKELERYVKMDAKKLKKLYAERRFM
jgi:Fe-S oxidoreductase